jgi:hypothetical protein
MTRLFVQIERSSELYALPARDKKEFRLHNLKKFTLVFSSAGIGDPVLEKRL